MDIIRRRKVLTGWMSRMGGKRSFYTCLGNDTEHVQHCISIFATFVYIMDIYDHSLSP